MLDTVTVATHPQPSAKKAEIKKADLLKELAQYAKPSNSRGLFLAAQELAIYWGAIALVLFAPWLAVKIIASAVAGFKLTSFYTLGHDATHRTLVANGRLNWVLAMVFSVPAMQNYRLWILDHHLQHHPKTNGEQHDFYQPFSKAEFDRLSPMRQWFEKFVRFPNVVGFGINFFFPWLLATRVMPNHETPPAYRREAWGYFAVLVAYQVLLLTFLTYAPDFAPITLRSSLLLGYFMPLVIFATVTGASLYLMHTHRNIPWFRGNVTRKGDFAPELCATHLTLPRPLSKFVHHVFAHSAHHAHAGVPVYNLLDAQLHLNRLLGDRLVVEPLSLWGALATMNACKLYDYEKHQWLDFDGKPTAPPIKLDARAA